MRAKLALFLASGMVLGGATVGPALGEETVGLSANTANAATVGHGGDSSGPAAVMSVYDGYSAGDQHGAHGARAQAQALVPDLPAVSVATGPTGRSLIPSGITTICDVTGTPPVMSGTSSPCPTSLTLTVGAGPLQLQVPNSWNLGANYQPGSNAVSRFSASSSFSTTPDNSFTVNDSRGLGTSSNWSVSEALPTPFTGPSPATTNTLGAVTYDPGSTAPVTPTSGTLSATPLKVLTATNSPGTFTWDPTLTVVIPPASPAGTYTTTLVTTLTAGP